MIKFFSALVAVTCLSIAHSASAESVAAQKNQPNVAKKQSAEYQLVDYTAINFDTTESELTKKFPKVKCEQMPNPKVRMCLLPISKYESISYAFFSGKLININGRTKNEVVKPPPVTCEVAKAKFRSCQQKSGDDAVDCLAGINAPADCH